jgi:peptide/bleomycin uptake transporter
MEEHMYYSFFQDKQWLFKAWGGLVFLIISIYLQVQITVAINSWYGGFYNILQKATEYPLSVFWDEMYKFSLLAFPYVLLASFTAWVTRIWAFWWRESITFQYTHSWRNCDKNIEGASQRIQEDAYRFTKIIESLGLQFIKALLTLIAFIPLLWGLSNDVRLPYLEQLHGSLVYVAIGVSLGGLIISWFVGIKLPGLEYNNQKVEAAFRKELVYAEDNRTDYAKPETIVELFTGLKVNYRRLFIHYGYFDIWLNSFEQMMIIVPYLIMAPSLFAGVILLGVLVQVSNAFSKVRESFSVFITNWTTITELRSIHKRLKEFEGHLK